MLLARNQLRDMTESKTMHTMVTNHISHNSGTAGAPAAAAGVADVIDDLEVRRCAHSGRTVSTAWHGMAWHCMEALTDR